MIVPGLRTLLPARTRLAEALFSSVQRRVLALFFIQPGRRLQSAEVIRLVKGGTGGVHRELRRLEEAGWLTAGWIGNQKHYEANRACPAFAELQGLVAKTIGGAAGPGSSGPPASREPARPARPHAGDRSPSSPALPETHEPAEVETAAPPAAATPPRDGWKVW
jgi:hypothetical protein